MSDWTNAATRAAFRSEGATYVLSQCGTIESPPKSNMTRYGKWYGLNGFPWCAQFASCMYHEVCELHGLPNPLVGLQSPNGFAGVTSAWAKAPTGWRLKQAEKPLPMDLFMYDHDSLPGGPGHVEICVKVSGSNVDLVGGNTGPLQGATPAQLREGGGVYLHTHTVFGDDGRHGRLLGVLRPSRKFFMP
jgi:CHAP domain